MNACVASLLAFAWFGLNLLLLRISAPQTFLTDGVQALIIAKYLVGTTHAQNICSQAKIYLIKTDLSDF